MPLYGAEHHLFSCKKRIAQPSPEYNTQMALFSAPGKQVQGAFCVWEGGFYA